MPLEDRQTWSGRRDKVREDAGGGSISEGIGMPFHSVSLQHAFFEEGVVSANLHVVRVEILSHQSLIQSALSFEILHLHRRLINIHVLVRVNVVIVVIHYFDGSIIEPLCLSLRPLILRLVFIKVRCRGVRHLMWYVRR